MTFLQPSPESRAEDQEKHIYHAEKEFEERLRKLKRTPPKRERISGKPSETNTQP